MPAGRPVGRFTLAPYRRIPQGGTLNVSVTAFQRKTAIDVDTVVDVTFTVIGQGHSATPIVVAAPPTFNPQTGLVEYWFPLSASSFTSDGPFTIEAVIHGIDGLNRDKNTDGGGFGLDPIKWVVNKNGTLPALEAWVAPSGGSDTTGTAGDRTKPFISIGKAGAALQAANGGKCDGCIIRLMQGIVDMLRGSPATTAWNTVNEAIVITADENFGGSKANTTLRENQDCPATLAIRVENLKVISQPGNFSGTIFQSTRPDYIYSANCEIVGAGFVPVNSTPSPSGAGNPYSESHDNKYYKDCVVHDCKYAFGRGQLCIGCSAYNVCGDVFTNFTGVIGNVVVDLVDPNQPTNPFHSDLWQRFGGGPIRNIVIYGLRATRLRYQGFEVRWDGTGLSPADMAFVNVFLQFDSAPYSAGAKSLWQVPADNVMFREFTQLGGGPSSDFWGEFNFFKSGTDPDVDITNLQVLGGLFQGVKFDTVGDANVDVTDWRHCHYIYTSGEALMVSPGSDVTSGDPGIDSFGRPLAGSPLINRLPAALISIDTGGSPRDATPDIGAYEFQAVDSDLRSSSDQGAFDDAAGGTRGMSASASDQLVVGAASDFTQDILIDANAQDSLALVDLTAFLPVIVFVSGMPRSFAEWQSWMDPLYGGWRGDPEVGMNLYDGWFWPHARGVILLSPVHLGGGWWRISWLSANLGSVFNVWVNGELAVRTTDTHYQILVDPNDVLRVSVSDDVAYLPAEHFPDRFTLYWEHAGRATTYRVEQYVGGNWIPRFNQQDNGQPVYEWESAVLADETMHRFRVIAIADSENETIISDMSALMVRRPDRPAIGWSYSSGTKKVTIS